MGWEGHTPWALGSKVAGNMVSKSVQQAKTFWGKWSMDQSSQHGADVCVWRDREEGKSPYG